MRLIGTLRRGTAACLLALLGVLGTGLPSHHHESPAGPEGTDVAAIGADHHSHGTLLVEHSERVRSDAPQVANAPVAFVELALPDIVRQTNPLEEPLRPLERAPPPGAPRAPPYVI